MEWLIIQINNQAPQRFIQVFVHRKYYRVARNSIGFNYVLLFYNIHCTQWACTMNIVPFLCYGDTMYNKVSFFEILKTIELIKVWST